MRDLRLDRLTGDLTIELGDVLLTSGAEAVAQNMMIRLKTFKGESFYNIDVGMPWFQHLLVKNPRPPILFAVLRQAILADPNIRDLRRMDFEYLPSERKLSVNIELLTDEDQLVEEEFILNV